MKIVNKFIKLLNSLMVVKGGEDDEGLFARPRTDDEFGTRDDILDF